HNGGRGGSCRRSDGQYPHTRTNPDAAVEVHYVFVGQPNASRGDEGADGRRLIGPVDAIYRITKIKRASAKRIGLAAGHETRQIGLSHDQLLGWCPIRPLRYLGDPLRAGPREALAADAYPVAQRLAVAEHEIEVGVRSGQDDSARRFPGAVIDERATELRC